MEPSKLQPRCRNCNDFRYPMDSGNRPLQSITPKYKFWRGLLQLELGRSMVRFSIPSKRNVLRIGNRKIQFGKFPLNKLSERSRVVKEEERFMKKRGLTDVMFTPLSTSSLTSLKF
ncbi:hypothetical protein SLE2022_081930 [Rubroshorea leprosula]